VCCENEITGKLDLSQFINLKVLDCSQNEITELILPPLLKKLNCDEIYNLDYCTIENINTFNKLKLKNSIKIIRKFIKSFVEYKKKIRQYYHPDNIALLCNENGELDLNLLEH
jgi:Leucine-rich repeat (LRR) protein